MTRVSVILLLPVMVMATGCAATLQATTAASHTVDEEDSDPYYDLLIRNGRVLDGSGTPWVRADVAIDGNRIAEIGQLDDVDAKEVWDAGGLYVAPGFIDTHSHAAGGLTDPDLSEARPLVAQGITSVMVNPDGGGPVDIGRQQQALLEDGLGVNVAQFVPHGSIRRDVLGRDDRSPNEDEMKQMKRLVRQGMEAGAFGLSSGLFYTPASYADTEELIELANVASEYNGAYQSHIRDEADYDVGVVAAVDEVIEIAEKAGLPGIVTHIKVLGPNVWGYSEALVHRIERAREQGVEVFADQYPYNASATGLSAALVPDWAVDGGMDAFRERLEDEELFVRIHQDMTENLARRGGPDRVQFRRVRQDPELEGQTLTDYAEQTGQEPVDAAIDLLEDGSPGIVSFNMHDRDVERLMRQPWTMTASDGGLVEKGEGVPHPRNYGAFPRKVATFVEERNVVDLAFAIRSMTHMPARVYGLENRGMIREGAYADIAVFDLEMLDDPAGFEEPHQLSEGMVYVLVNGEPVIKERQQTGAKNGRILVR